MTRERERDKGRKEVIRREKKRRQNGESEDDGEDGDFKI